MLYKFNINLKKIKIITFLYKGIPTNYITFCPKNITAEIKENKKLQGKPKSFFFQ